ncbi:SusC/RagA family TonB-linked outer membrane protein [Chitinophaga defluvii]|uniref:TonB-dependent receptor n=1 Tax=Chitinophaga defluvii TaxID=3163343 RepID=A0ABV2T0F4_9BACT
MRITVLLLLMGLMQVSAKSVAQRINLSVQNANMQDVIEQLRKQSGYNFLYIKKEVLSRAKPVTEELIEATIEEALNKIFAVQPLIYQIKDKTVIIKPSADKPVIKVQQKSITGSVTDEKGEILIGVSILVKGTQTGTVTDAQGKYTIAANSGSVLVFRYIGYQTQEVTVGSENPINVSLLAVPGGLDEVVVIAYGTQKKETVTGAIASIRTREIKQSPAANLAVTLAGRLPGLTSIQRSGQPGRDITQLFIRGQGTINAQSPIILVDGIERDLTYIDPNEVESITILKDASSTAIFGVRGANGVILVTTKRGTSEEPEINFVAEAGAQDFPRFITPVNAYDFASLRNLALTNDGLPAEYSADALKYYKSQEDLLRYANTDWRKLLVKNYSYQQRYNLNVSGASKNTRYFVNAGYLNQGGQFNTERDLNYDPSFKLNRYNFRSNIDIQLNKNLKAFLNVAGYLEQRNSPYAVGGDNPIDWIIYFMNRMPAVVPGPLTPDGQVITYSDIDHPAYGLINRSGYTQQKRSNVLATYGMEQNLDFITKGLSVKAIVSFDARTVNNLEATRKYEKYIQIINPNLQGVDGRDSVYYRPFNNDQNTPLTIGGGRSFETLSNFQGFVNYAKTIGKHDLSGMLLYQQQNNIINNELPFKLMGMAARVTYGYNARYFLEFNAGYNGSEQFAAGQRFGFFPAVSASWLISNESFLHDNSIFNLLKLRGSFGKVGNDRIGNRRFLYLDDIQVVGGGFSGSLGNGQTINYNLLKNAQLQWEVAKKYNLGLEVGLFNQFNLVADVFYEKRDNILRNRGIIPELNGLPMEVLPPVNIGVVENKGYEIELNYKKAFSKDLSLLARINLNYATNRQIYADEPLLPQDYAYRYRETDYRIGQMFGYIVDGYFADQNDIAKSPVQNVGGHESRPGDFKYKDLNNDGVINERDIAPIGYSNVPEYQYGAAFNLTYKGLDFSVLFQGISNVSNYYSDQGVFGDKNYVARHLESWTAERAASGMPINYPRLSTQANPNERPNSFFILNASYLRLKNMEIGYTFPARWSKAIGAKRLRIYANGLNLLTWDKLPTKEFDPELTNSRVYPITRLYNWGVNFTF